MSDNYDYLFKIIVIGPAAVGKSSIISNFTGHGFIENNSPTLGVDYAKKSVNVEVNGQTKNCRLQLWDTAGQEKFDSISQQYYRDSQGALLIYDITNLYSFRSLQNWLMELKKQDQNIQIIVLGNKNDCESKRQVSYEEGENIAQKYNLIFMETSAKTGLNINEAFKELLKIIIYHKELQEGNNSLLQYTNSQFEPEKRNISKKELSSKKLGVGCC